MLQVTIYGKADAELQSQHGGRLLCLGRTCTLVRRTKRLVRSLAEQTIMVPWTTEHVYP